MSDQIEQDTGQVERETLIPAAAEEVWEAITGPGFLAEEVRFELCPGGEADFRLADGSVRSGWVEEAIPPTGDPDGAGGLVFWWSEDGDPATRVELTLTPEGEEATRLRVVESRPLEVLDITGIPLPGSGGSSYGPTMVALA